MLFVQIETNTRRRFGARGKTGKKWKMYQVHMEVQEVEFPATLAYLVRHREMGREIRFQGFVSCRMRSPDKAADDAGQLLEEIVGSQHHRSATLY